MKIYSLFIFMFIVSLAYGQILIIDNYKIDTSWVNVDLEALTNFRVESSLTNTLDEPLELDWKIEIEAFEPNWELSISENNYDFVPGIYESPLPMVLDSLTSDQPFNVHIYPNQTAGCGKFKTIFFESGTDTKIDSIFYEIAINSENCLSATDGLSIANSLVVYPNPVDDYLIFESELQIDRIEIYGTDSRKILSSKFPKKKINLKELSSGFYFVRFHDANGNILSKKIYVGQNH